MAVARQRHDNDRACESVSVGGEAPAEHTDSDTHTQREREHIEHTRSVCGRVSVSTAKGHSPKGTIQVSKGQSGRVPKDIVQRALSKSQRALSKDSVGSARAR